MPATLWSAPSSDLNALSKVISSFVTATLTDISPNPPPLIPATSLSLGTRIRIFASGSYIASTTASTITWQLQMNAPGTPIATTPAILGVSNAITAVAVTGIPWWIWWSGKVTSLSDNAGTSAVVVGRGFHQTASSLSALTAQTLMNQTLASATITQTATGLNTMTNQNVLLCATIATNTGLTSITTDELTCELIG